MCGDTRTRAPAGVRSWSSPATRQFRCSTNCSPCLATRTRCAASPEVELDESDGMPARCVLSLDNISLVRGTLLTERIARLAPPRMQAVCDAPCHHDRLLNRARGAKFVAAPLAAVAISIRERRRAHRARGTDRSERSCDRRAARPGTATGGLVRQLRARRAERRADGARHQGGLFIPLGAQAHVSARRTRGWTLDARHRAASRRDTARSTTTRLTWTARPGHAVEPGETQRFRFRLRAPSRPGPLCFKIDQHFSPSVLGERPKVDRWRGPVRSRRPASCMQIAAPSLRP